MTAGARRPIPVGSTNVDQADPDRHATARHIRMRKRKTATQCFSFQYLGYGLRPGCPSITKGLGLERELDTSHSG